MGGHLARRAWHCYRGDAPSSGVPAVTLKTNRDGALPALSVIPHNRPSAGLECTAHWMFSFTSASRRCRLLPGHVFRLSHPADGILRSIMPFDEHVTSHSLKYQIGPRKQDMTNEEYAEVAPAAASVSAQSPGAVGGSAARSPARRCCSDPTGWMGLSRIVMALLGAATCPGGRRGPRGARRPGAPLAAEPHTHIPSPPAQNPATQRVRDALAPSLTDRHVWSVAPKRKE